MSDTAATMEGASGSPSTMYARVGGARGIRSAVNGFYIRVLRDQRVNGYFEGKNVDWILRHQYKVFTIVTGGQWDGDDEPIPPLMDYMRSTHEGLGITGEHFGIVAGHLNEALVSDEWPADDVDDFLGKVGGLGPAIVTR